jgi:hypothetical protein
VKTIQNRNVLDWKRYATRQTWTCALGVLLVVISTIFGAYGKPTEMGLAILAVAVAMAFSNLDKLEFFKGAGEV